MASTREIPFVPIIFGAFLLGLIGGVWMLTRPSGPPQTVSNPPSATPTPSSGRTASPSAPATTDSAPRTEPINWQSQDPRVVRKLYRNLDGPKTAKEILANLDDVLKILENGTIEEKKRALEKLEEDLWSAPNAESIHAIRQFLQIGSDAATGEGFKLGEKGVLEESPTLRVFLLDQLGSLGLASGDRAPVQIAKEMLTNKRSADEWAVSLRNVTWFEPENRTFVGEKVREMLDYQPWVSAPSPGFLESFDGIVFAKDVSAVPKLFNLSQVENGALKRATSVAMDRLAEVSALEVMNYLNANPAIYADRPMLRSDFYTAADLSNPSQLKAVETYLSRPDVSQDAKAKLLGGLTTPGSFYSDNLFTDPPKPPSVEQDTARAETLRRVGTEWLQSNRFPSLNAELQSFIEANTVGAEER